MKFKRYMIFVITILLAICLVGCGEANTEKAVANNIEKSTAKLDGIIQRLDEMNYDDIVIQDISPFAGVGTSNLSGNQSLEKTKYYTVGTGETKTYTSNSLVANKTKDNAKFVSADKIDIEKASNSSNYSNPRKNKIYNSQKTTAQNCQNGNCENNQISSSVSRKSNYTPRYVNETSNSFSRDGLNSYLNQIENVYNTCADCISCNAECKNETSKIKQNISDCKVLSTKLKDGSIKLTEKEIDSCNNCLNNLQACSYKLNLTKDNINIKEKDVTKLKDNLSKNLVSLQEAYSKLLTALESRLEYLTGCNDCINSLCDIINKTNVNMIEAEKNKSNKDDIIKSEDKLKEEQTETVTENGILDSTKNYKSSTTAKKSNINSKNKNYSIKNSSKKSNSTSAGKKSSNANTSNKNTNSTKQFLQNKTVKSNINKIKQKAQNIAKPNNSTNPNNNVQKQQKRDNIHKTPVLNEKNMTNSTHDVANKNQNVTNNQTPNNDQNFTNNGGNVTNNSGFIPNENTAIVPNNNIPNNVQNANNDAINAAPNGITPYNPNIQNGYGYPYNYGYNNRPYPPRNIDTYRTIIKNIDTYSPNYVPGNGYNTQPFAYGNQNLNNQNNLSSSADQTILNNQNDDTQNQNDASLNHEQTQNEQVTNSQPNKIITNTETPTTEQTNTVQNNANISNGTTMQNDLQNSNLSVNTDQNTTMQTSSVSKINSNLSPEEDVSEVKEMVNELY